MNDLIKLPPKQQMVYDVIMNNPGINQVGIVQILSSTKGSVGRYVRDLIKKQLIQFNGENSKTGGYYII